MEGYSQYIDAAAAYGIKIVGALLIFVIGKMIARSLANFSQKAMDKFFGYDSQLFTGTGRTALSSPKPPSKARSTASFLWA